MKKSKISFCTVCMNRVHHLKETLPKNIKDNISYGNLEFVVLDYNSQDDLENWIFSEMGYYLSQGILVYLKTEKPEKFFMSHSKNVVSKQADGDIICNVDADNFLGKGFAEYIDDSFRTERNAYLTVDKRTTKRDCFGRICMRKKDFLKIRGYDESMIGYGFEDFDLRNRLELLGRKALFISEKSFLQALVHDDKERLINESNATSIFKIFVRFIDHAKSELLYLFDNNKYFRGKIAISRLINSESIYNLFPEKRNYEYANFLVNDKWNQGNWLKSPNEYSLENKECEMRLKLGIVQKNPLELFDKLNKNVFHEIIDDIQIMDMMMFFSQINNRIIMEKNRKEKKIAVNPNGFGETVFC
ncbi:glycosyltransferase family A protein [Flagellimonas meridianipacifica]|uniref:Galactosyltransferase-like protein n=1 Tax=Flagellimonas meridianipacifica TaxID=1080225 RepID=A0A2T0MCP8_9FLAO|nr:glycosyltransferase family A protein [Allomuricauda pacifica]PRX55253.1 galactosyltransferase-like protein [Allomuricauda pacifica]